jgi:hypothetical protein
MGRASMHAVETLSNAPVSQTPAVPRSLRFVLGWAVVWAGFGRPWPSASPSCEESWRTWDRC